MALHSLERALIGPRPPSHCHRWTHGQRENRALHPIGAAVQGRNRQLRLGGYLSGFRDWDG